MIYASAAFVNEVKIFLFALLLVDKSPPARLPYLGVNEAGATADFLYLYENGSIYFLYFYFKA